MNTTKKIRAALTLLLASGAMVLTSCNIGSQPTGGSSKPTQDSSQPTVSEEGPIVDPQAANGSFDFSSYDWQEKTKITAALEKYAMDNFTAGIPLYDDSSSEAFSQRVNPKSQKYITNYGFGIMEGTLDPNGYMYDNNTIVEPREEYRSYFHGYTNTDSGTFNGWNATGSDVSDRMSMISSGYFGVEMNATQDGYSWKGELSRDSYPVMLELNPGRDFFDSGSDATRFKETIIKDENDPNVDKTGVYWRVYLHVGEGYAYNAVPGSKWAGKAEFDGRKVQIEDYITPFKAMLDKSMVRATELMTDSGGFYGTSNYKYGSSHTMETWNSTVGIVVREDLCTEEYGVIDFRFISPHAATTARTALSSSLYSPVPQAFLDAIGGANNYGVRGSTANSRFDNFLCFGAYIPVEWQDQKELIYKKNENYHDAARYHFNGYVEKVYTSDKADELAWEDFKLNKLDQCTIPVSALVRGESYAKTYRTEGSTIIKINLNTCTVDEWNYFFGPDGKVYKHSDPSVATKGNGKWNGVKTIMSNRDFLRGFFYAINREELAKTAGRNPAISYLSNAYMIDPTGKQSYRASEAAKSVVQTYIDDSGSDYCYNRDLAALYFKKCGEALHDMGWENEEITIEGFYRYQSTIDNLGDYIKKGVASVFNEACKKFGLTLDVQLKVGGTNYTDTYTIMDHGEFDFAEGAVSGNVLDPLNFMSTTSSSASLNQGFNLNWGHPTNKLGKRPAVYTPLPTEDKTYDELHWSFDALWTASQGFCVVENGETTELGANQRFLGPDQSDDSTGATAKSSEILFLMDMPDGAFDENGDCYYSFEALDEMAIFPNDDAGTSQGGYYFRSGKLVPGTELNGYIAVTMPLTDVKGNCQDIANAIKRDVTRFTVQFYLRYKVFPGKSNELIKQMIVVSEVTLESLGLEPIAPKGN
ncbi:MAG: ABC transporter substrate-binding protein [Candidatus Enteromonas sp.]|nr:ABC transporter substrate-binding protein [Candidatus Enteromonas sp.]